MAVHPSKSAPGVATSAAPVSALGTPRSSPTRYWLWLSVFLAIAFAPTRRNILHWGSWAAALAVELALVVTLRGGHIYGWEQAVERSVQASWRGEAAFVLTFWLTNTISVAFILAWTLVVVATFVSHRAVTSIVLLATFPLHVLAQFPKALVDRTRPSDAFAGIEGIGGYRSFPSGHSEFAISFYGILAYLICRHVEIWTARAVIIAAWLALVVLTGVGRIAEGRHWPLDVLASYVVGAGLLSGLIWLDRALRATAVKVSDLESGLRGQYDGSQDDS